MEFTKSTLKFADKSNLSANSCFYTLLIQYSGDAINYIVFDDSDFSIFAFENITLTSENSHADVSVNDLSNVFNQDIFQLKFKKVILVVDGHNQLVPLELFDDKFLKVLLFQENESDIEFNNIAILSNTLKNISANLVFSINIEIHKYFLSLFPNLQIVHSSTMYLDSFLASYQYQKHEILIGINVHNTYFEVIILRNAQLTFFNIFKIASIDDINYYLQFLADQLEIDISQGVVIVSGGIDIKSSIVAIIESYVKTVNFPEINLKLKNNTFLSQEHHFRYFSLLNYLLCV